MDFYEKPKIGDMSLNHSKKKQSVVTEVDVTEFTAQETLQPLERIGMGFCGSVWAERCHDPAIAKLAMKRGDGGPGRSLVNEYEVHNLLLQTLKQNPTFSGSFSIPSCYGFLNEKNANWSQILPRLPRHSTACEAIISEKIMPVGPAARRLLVEKYLKRDPEMVLKDESNKHCLLRLYLGRRRIQVGRPSRSAFYSLRNYPLHVDQMEELGLAVEDYAKSVAEALAFLYWCAGIDGNDVEFVLATPRRSLSSDPLLKRCEFESHTLGRHSIWMLDFDCCRRMPLDETGIDMAVRSFWRNDPFYPRPGSTNPVDQHLWDVFCEHFLGMSRVVLSTHDAAVQRLPQLLMDRIVETKGKFAKGTTVSH